MSRIQNVSRRGFLKGVVSAGAFVLGAQFLSRIAVGGSAPSSADPVDRHRLSSQRLPGHRARRHGHHRGASLGDGHGQPHRLCLVILADELEADWKRVRIEQAIGDAKYGDQDTDGSHSIRSFFDVMREAGATARTMLVRAAAQQWSVPASECEAEPAHGGAHADAAARWAMANSRRAPPSCPCPKKETLKFKPEAPWRYIGKDASIYDLEDICTGKAAYGMDARMDGMVYASIEHPPVLGGKVKSCDDRRRCKVPGVRQTVTIDPFKPPHVFQPLGGVAVIADNTWAAFQGRKKLKIDWDNGAERRATTPTQYKKEMQETARTAGQSDAQRRRRGRGVRQGRQDHRGRILRAAPGARLHGAAGRGGGLSRRQGGRPGLPRKIRKPCRRRSPRSGHPQGERDLPRHACWAADSGASRNPTTWPKRRCSRRNSDARSRWCGRREDDIKFDYYHTVAAMYMKAALGAERKAHGLAAALGVPAHRLHVRRSNNTYGERRRARHGLDGHAVRHSQPARRKRPGQRRTCASDGCVRWPISTTPSRCNRLPTNWRMPPGAIRSNICWRLIGPDRVIDQKMAAGAITTTWARLPGVSRSTPARLRRVTEMAAEKAGWGKRKLGKGEGMGVAVHRSFLTYVATVVQVQMDDKGKVRIRRVDTAVDAGTDRESGQRAQPVRGRGGLRHQPGACAARSRPPTA